MLDLEHSRISKLYIYKVLQIVVRVVNVHIEIHVNDLSIRNSLVARVRVGFLFS